MGPTDSTQVPDVDNAVDQAARMVAFLRERSEWRIWFDGDRHAWYGERMVPGGWETHARHMLGCLLDALGAP